MKIAISTGGGDAPGLNAVIRAAVLCALHRGFDVYKRNVDPSSLSLGQYRTSTLGGQARIGVPFTDIDTVSFGLGYEDTGITVYADSPLRIVSYVNTFGQYNTAVLGNVGWARDTRDSAIYPTSGAISRASVETGLPGGTLRFYKVNAQHQRYFPLTRDFTLYLNGDIGYGNG
ncbi:MAG: BamA/TamA family outer membrane protein, partial [Gemmatimonadetes bacterium]|nr:BamA/TamA family outer membrane protein [Gemmatimonadota bacterium]